MALQIAEKRSIANIGLNDSKIVFLSEKNDVNEIDFTKNKINFDIFSPTKNKFYMKSRNKKWFT